MSFKLLKSMEDAELVKFRIDSQAYTLGDALMLDRTSNAIDVVPATSSTTTFGIYGIAVETKAATATELLGLVIEEGMYFIVDSTNNSNVNHNYQRMLLTDKGVVNNTGTDNATKEAVFMQTGVIGAAADKKVVGKILKVANLTATA